MLEKQTNKRKRLLFAKIKSYENLPENEYFFIHELLLRISEDHFHTQVVEVDEAVDENLRRQAKELTVPGTGHTPDGACCGPGV